MINILLDFSKAKYFLLFIAVTVVIIFWVYERFKKGLRISLLPFVAINALLFTAWGLLTGINHDTAEHFHCAWLVSQGLIPFRDFWQHHPPYLWVMLAPIFKQLKPTFFIFEAARIFCVFLFALIGFLGWKIAQETWREKASRNMYVLLLLSGSIAGQFLLFRPDLFMDLFLLLGIYFTLKIPGNRRLLPVFCAGASFALAATFHLKQYFLYFLPLIIIFCEQERFRIVKFLVYVLGFFLGVAPTLFYLVFNDIVTDFIFWVLLFNSQRIGFYVYFPLALGAAGIWGAVLLLNRYREGRDVKSLVLFAAFCLSTLSSLTSHSFFYSFYIGFWFIICAIAGCGCDIAGMARKIPSLLKRSAVTGLFLSMIIFPNVLLAIKHEEVSFSEHKRVISALMEYCRGGESCMVLLPLHPVFAHDASRLYSHWQHLFAGDISDLRNDITKKNVADAIFARRPAVIEYQYQPYRRKEEIFIVDLLLKKLASPREIKLLKDFLEKNYTVIQISKSKYYVRNDKLNGRHSVAGTACME